MAEVCQKNVLCTQSLGRCILIGEGGFSFGLGDDIACARNIGAAEKLELVDPDVRGHNEAEFCISCFIFLVKVNLFADDGSLFLGINFGKFACLLPIFAIFGKKDGNSGRSAYATNVLTEDGKRCAVNCTNRADIVHNASCTTRGEVEKRFVIAIGLGRKNAVGKLGTVRMGVEPVGAMVFFYQFKIFDLLLFSLDKVYAFRGDRIIDGFGLVDRKITVKIYVYAHNTKTPWFFVSALPYYIMNFIALQE